MIVLSIKIACVVVVYCSVKLTLMLSGKPKGFWEVVGFLGSVLVLFVVIGLFTLLPLMMIFKSIEGTW